MRERVFENMMANKTKAPRAAADGDGLRAGRAREGAKCGVAGRWEGDRPATGAVLRPSGP